MELECFTLFDPDSLFLYLSSKFKNIQIKALYQNLPQFNLKFTPIQPQNYSNSIPNSLRFRPKLTPTRPKNINCDKL